MIEEDALCSTCEADTADFRCQECGTLECMRCRACYEVVNNPPALCWRCQAEADQEWLRDMSKRRRIGPRRKETPNA